MVRSAPHRHQKNSKRLKWKRIVHITLLTLVFTWMIYQFNHKRSQTAGEEERHLRRKSLNDVRVDLFGRKALKPELGATSTVPGGDGIDGALDGDGNTMEKPLYADEDFGKEETINNDMDVLERGVEDGGDGDEEGDEERDEERDGEEKMDTEKFTTSLDTESLTSLETVNSEKGLHDVWEGKPLRRQDEEKWDEASQQNLGSVKMDGGADMHVKDSTSQGTDNNPSIMQSTENAKLEDNLEEADDSDMDDTDDEVF